jgi:FlaA1/EpsC-like NDP-sugar epimerase
LGSDQKQTIVFFGAGGAGRAFKHHSGIVPDFYVDNSRELYGTEVDGVPVVYPDALLGLANVTVYITSGYVEEITQEWV